MAKSRWAKAVGLQGSGGAVDAGLGGIAGQVRVSAVEPGNGWLAAAGSGAAEADHSVLG